MGHSTPVWSFYEPATGETGWGDAVNTNCDTLDSILSFLKNVTFTTVTGLTGSRASIQGQGLAAGDLEIVPGPLTDPSSNYAAQLHLYSRTGTDNEELRFSTGFSEYRIESVSDNAGVPRSIILAAGGQRIPSSITSKVGIEVLPDASVRLAGSMYTTDGKTWGSGYCSIWDYGNTGDTRLIINSAVNGQVSTTDSAAVVYRIRADRKWAAGVNWSGDNTDSFDFVKASDPNPYIASLGLLESNGAVMLEWREKATSAPASPSANRVRMFHRNNAGKGQLCALFPTGAVQVIATEP